MSELSPDLSDASSLGPALITLKQWFDEAFELKNEVRPASLTQLIKQCGLLIDRDLFDFSSRNNNHLSIAQLCIFHTQLGSYVSLCLTWAVKHLELRSAADSAWVEVVGACIAFANTNVKLCLEMLNCGQAGVHDVFNLLPHVFTVSKTMCSCDKAVYTGLDQSLLRLLKSTEKTCTEFSASLLTALTTNISALQAANLDLAYLLEELLSLCIVAQEANNLGLMNLGWKHLSLVLADVFGGCDVGFLTRTLDFLLIQIRNYVEDARIAVKDMQASKTPPSPQSAVVRYVKICRFYLLNLNKIFASQSLFSSAIDRLASLCIDLFSLSDPSLGDLHPFLVEQIQQQPGPVMEAILFAFLQNSAVSDQDKIRLLTLFEASASSNAQETRNIVKSEHSSENGTVSSSNNSDNSGSSGDNEKNGPAKLHVMLLICMKCSEFSDVLQAWLIPHALGITSRLLQNAHCYALAFHSIGRPLLQNCVGMFIAMLDHCQKTSKVDVLVSALWRVLSGSVSPLQRQFALGCWCEFLERIDVSSQVEFVMCCSALIMCANDASSTTTSSTITSSSSVLSQSSPSSSSLQAEQSGDQVLTEGQRLICELWAQAFPLLEPFTQQLIVQALSLDRQASSEVFAPRPSDLDVPFSVPVLSLPIKACLLSILPLSCLSQSIQEYLCAKVLRVAVQDLEQWISSNGNVNANRGHLVECLAGLLQHSGLVRGPPDVLRCCELVGLLFEAQNSRLLASSPGLFRSALHLACSLDLMRCYTPQRTLRILSALELLIVAHPWSRPLVAQFLGNTAHIPLRFSEPGMQEEIFRKLCKLFNIVLTVKEQPELWNQFVAGLSMFHTFSSLSVLYQERLEELIPRIAYDDLVDYISGLAHPTLIPASREWELLIREQQGACDLHNARKRVLDAGFEQARNVRTKIASTALQDVCANIRNLKDLLGLLSGTPSASEQFLEADRLWEVLRQEAKKIWPS